MFLLKGTIMGVKSVDNTDRNTGEVRTKMFVGVSVPKTNGYDGESVSYDIQITKKQIPEGVAAHYEKLKGNEIFVPVLAFPWAGRNGNAGLNWFLADDGLPKNFK
ncbi:MAG TPA: hypothetical protein EYG20_10065 [Alcanivorax sp.]|nr:hypothetical protein [Alcanivorax sp.]